ncbi:hypothetical protein GOP47_0018225 [Adiantum capillus-veneris]|uniref:PROP1-like PPR domain-containing protein n=1 Tax=Adiantum capillus-veneris TaxID=13818 RepID=A0A9D4UHD1_ADICA|nr:hypothetical protein GOP47_0018225 [Adiantum capillus-veneris]
MAELSCSRFSELVNSALPSCAIELARCSNPGKDRVLCTFVVAPLKLAYPIPVLGCAQSIAPDSANLRGNDNPSFKLQRHAVTHWIGNAMAMHGNSVRRVIASSCTAEMQGSASLAYVSASETCDEDKPRDATTSTHTAGGTNNINVRHGIYSSPTTGTAEFVRNFQLARASSDSEASADQTHYTHDSDAKKSELLQDDQSLSQFAFLISALPTDDAMGDVLPPLRVSALSSLLQKVKPSSKIEELFHWMKANCGALNPHSLVFKELGKRQEWSVLDNLLRDELKLSNGKAICEVFNEVFQVCVAQNAPLWASKWFSSMMQEGAEPNLTTFELLMPLFRRHNMVEDAYFAFQHMTGTGVECVAASSAMILLHLQAGQLTKAKQIYIRMKEANKEPLKSFLISELNSYLRHGNVKQAEELVKFMQEFEVKLDLLIYNAMITVNGKSGQYSRAKEWFFAIEKDGLRPNEATYRSVIGACGRAGSLYAAFYFYDRMIALNFTPNLANYNTLIHLHRKVDHEGRIVALLSDMKSTGCLPDSATFNSVLKVYERYGRLVKLPEALQLLREAGWEPNEVCYGLLIRAYIRCNMVGEAMEVFSKLCVVGKLEEIMCHNLICMCKSEGCYDEAIHVFHEMQRCENIAPCLRTSSSVIDAYALKGAIKEGEALYKELKSQHELDAATYTVVLNMYLEAGLLDEAAEVLREVLQDKELNPDMYLFLSMLKVCDKHGLQNEAVELYWRIVNCNMLWTQHLYIEVVHCCGRLLPVEEIVKVFDSMRAAKTPIDTMTSNLLMDIFGKAGLLENIEGVFRLARMQGVHDCISFSTMIGAYGSQKKFDQMEFFLNQMLNEGLKECVEAYNAVLEAYGNSGMINMMKNTFEKMRMAGCIPNLATYNTLIKVYGQEGLIKDIQRVLEQMKKSGLKLDSNSYISLIHAYGSANKLDESLEYFQEMQKAGFEPDLITYTRLMSGLRAGGYGNDAIRLSNWINTGGLM